MPEFYLGQWEAMSAANSPDGIPYWRPPGGAAESEFVIDLRSRAEQGAEPVADGGLCLVAYPTARSYPQLIASLGNVLDGQISTPQKNALQSNLGKSIASTRLDQVMLELLQVHGDPTGVSGWKPMRAGDRRSPVVLALNGTLLAEPRSESHPAFTNRIAVFQADYRRAVLAGASEDLLRRWTGAEMLTLFGRMGDDLMGIVPVEEQLRGWAKPSTVITEDFTGSADTLLENHTPSPTNWGSWDQVGGSLDISNSGTECTNPNGNEYGIYVANNGGLSSDAMYVQAQTVEGAGSNIVGVAVRITTGATPDYYECDALDSFPSSDGFRIRKHISGTPTEIDSVTGTNVSDLLYVEWTASDVYTLKYGGVTKLGPTTDSSVTGNLYGGLSKWASGSNRGSIDDFEAGDLIASAGVRLYHSLARGTNRGLARGVA